MLFERKESLLKQHVECQPMDWKGRGGRNEGWKDGMSYGGWLGRREGDREHTWGVGEVEGDGEGVNREREEDREA